MHSFKSCLCCAFFSRLPSRHDGGDVKRKVTWSKVPCTRLYLQAATPVWQTSVWLASSVTYMSRSSHPCMHLILLATYPINLPHPTCDPIATCLRICRCTHHCFPRLHVLKISPHQPLRAAALCVHPVSGDFSGRLPLSESIVTRTRSPDLPGR
jgi:hypothetical protein